MLRHFLQTTHRHLRRWRGPAMLCVGLVLMSLWLWAGCEPKAQRTPPPPPAVETPEPGAIPAQPPDAGDAPAAPDAETSYNPYEGITETGQPPPDDYHADPLYWIPGMPYNTRTGFTHRGEVTTSAHVLPDSEQRAARVRKRSLPEYEKLQELVKTATNEQQRKNYVQAYQEKIRQISVEEDTRGLSPLHAAKYLKAGDAARQFAQQALDENPDDFHTLYVWTQFQSDSPAEQVTGYRRLLEMKPNSARVLFELGTFRHAVAASERVRLLEKSIQVEPDAAIKRGRLYYLAQAYHDSGDTSQAIALLKRHLTTATLDLYSQRQVTKQIASLERGEGWLVFVD